MTPTDDAIGSHYSNIGRPWMDGATASHLLVSLPYVRPRPPGGELQDGPDQLVTKRGDSVSLPVITARVAVR
ncbi:hypothetical protein [Actinophytocola algeriensis]|uniref:Uncharacterized protein n=1 Tax=Actinophytocola algeriensis TaxID=1768010 RepID=A0A7W7Q124_9PSEU|nr:hypothetical protein [Actinophytocola algeriensis]MBB4905045.1 hypothetical protein [Actinophytocola algeriensis]MBE1476095.1 hypothetical protein [Actinophytocola algeriensis]